jgi:hypothetical protein
MCLRRRSRTAISDARSEGAPMLEISWLLFVAAWLLLILTPGMVLVGLGSNWR